MKSVKMKGLSGNISFDDWGFRRNFSIDIVRMTINSEMTKVCLRERVILSRFNLSLMINNDWINKSTYISTFWQWQIAHWSEAEGLQVVAARYNRIPQPETTVENKTYIVTSIYVSIKFNCLFPIFLHL